MDARTVEVIRKKLDYLEKTLAELEPYLKAGYAEYVRQPAYRRATERLVQIIVEGVSQSRHALPGFGAYSEIQQKAISDMPSAISDKRQEDQWQRLTM